MRYRMLMSILCMLAAGLILSQTGMAATAPAQPKVDLGAFVKETMAMKMDGNQTDLAMWFPYEFYVEANLEDSTESRATIEKNMEFLKPYITIIVQCSQDKPDGSTSYAAEKDVQARAFLTIGNGPELRPLTNVPPLVSATVAAMKAVMASEGDAGGASLHVLVFSNKDSAGGFLADAMKKGKVKLLLKSDAKYKEVLLTWNTPFDAIRGIPACAKCREKLSAKWSYCPWCGEKMPN